MASEKKVKRRGRKRHDKDSFKHRFHSVSCKVISGNALGTKEQIQT